MGVGGSEVLVFGVLGISSGCEYGGGVVGWFVVVGGVDGA